MGPRVFTFYSFVSKLGRDSTRLDSLCSTDCSETQLHKLILCPLVDCVADLLHDERYNSLYAFLSGGPVYSGFAHSQEPNIPRIRVYPGHGYHWCRFILKVIFCLLGGFQLMMWFGATLCFIVFGLSKGTQRHLHGRPSPSGEDV